MAERADLLFELGTEELPPVALKRLSESLTREFIAGLDNAKLEHGEVSSYAAPRRLAVLVKECAVTQPNQEIERRGPAVAAAFDADGNATKACEGFARSCGITVDQLQRIETDKGEWVSYTLHQEGKPAAELLPEIAENALNKLPIPKRMRWGSSEAQFVRPVHWVLFLHGDGVVPCTILDAVADRLSYGHRFHHPASIRIDKPADYADKLHREGYVISNFAERRDKIREQVLHTAEALGGRPDLDDDLLDEVTALNEWPVPIAGSFEERFLAVPHEALVLTMKQNQKYFPLFDAAGKLMNHFITIANIDSPKPELIKEGNERVVRPRLADAMFFWTQDGKKRLEDHIESLKHVVFQQKLGSMYDKSVRISELAAFIAGRIDGDVDSAKRAGMLSRCDLMTEMVYEFPEMQGIMGRYQAGRDGEQGDIAQAMDEFYMPRFSGDELPRTKTGIAVSLAEKIDTLLGIFGIGMKPTGDKDPFGLRRAALGALRIMREHSLNIDLHELLSQSRGLLADCIDADFSVDQVYDFMIERLKGIYTEQGTGLDLFAAVAAVRPTSVLDFDQRLTAVSEFQQLPASEVLAAANKRIRNILKKVDGAVPSEVDASLFEESEEQRLYDQIQAMSEQVGPMMQGRDYAPVLKTLADLREPVDAFFDKVLVMADNEAVKNNRLAMLSAMNSLFMEVADVSQLQQN